MSPPTNSVVVCIDEMGPMSARSHPGKELVRARGGRANGRASGRAKQELDYGRRPNEGYVFGAFVPATGEALTATYHSRPIHTFADFLEKVEA